MNRLVLDLSIIACLAGAVFFTNLGKAQFWDRDAPAEMAKVSMEGFQEFMVKPDNLDRILAKLERARKRIFEN